MISKLRIKGRILLVGNIGLMSLVLATGIMLVLCVNFSVLFYELFLRERLPLFFSSGQPFTDLAVSVFLLSVGLSAYWQIKLGSDRYFLRRSQKKGASAGDIFYYFHPVRAFGAFVFCLKLLLLKLVYFAVSFLPFVLCASLLVFMLRQEMSALVALSLVVGSVAFFLSGAVFYSSITSSFFLAKYYYISGSCLNFSHLISSSYENMKSNKKILLRLRRSFAGWFLLCLLVLPIGYVWSYYNQTMAAAATEFIED